MFCFQPQAQYGGMSAIPSPPTVFTAQPEIYQTFQINNPPQVGYLDSFYQLFIVVFSLIEILF